MASLEATLDLALQRQKAGDLGEARRLFEAALAVDPANILANHMLGAVLLGLGRPGEAEARLALARRLEPSSAGAALNHGNALHALGRLAEAIQAFGVAIGLEPRLAAAYSNRGNALRLMGRLPEALIDFDRAVALEPGYARAWSNRGLLLIDLERPGDAAASLETAIALAPTMAAAHCNLGIARYALGRLDAALESFDRALALQPAYPEAVSNRAIILKELGDPASALTEFDRALALRPGDPDALYNRGLTRLLLGELEAGLADYDYRPTGPLRGAGAPPGVPLWDGSPLQGRRLLIFAEQGMGDALQFCRYLPRMAGLAPGLAFLCRPRMARLMRDAGLGVEILADLPNPARFDLALPLMSLARLFPPPSHEVVGPYLKAEPDRVDRWRDRIGGGGFRIAVSWQGNPASRAEHGRSFPLALLAPLAALPGVRLISVQREHGLDQLQRLPHGMTVETLGDAFDSGPDAFLDSAAVLEAVDLTISCDSAVGHLAGGLGRPVWLALKTVPHWPWGLQGDSTPWYPKTRLYRQARAGHWEGVFERMGAELERLRAIDG